MKSHLTKDKLIDKMQEILIQNTLEQCGSFFTIIDNVNEAVAGINVNQAAKSSENLDTRYLK